MKDNPETRAQKPVKMISLWQLLMGDHEVGFRVGEDGYASALIMRKRNGTIYEVDGRSAERMHKLDKIYEMLGLHD
ncbi:MAG: hypothetical protein KJ955_03860 [Nanoarchaeota archaeon]|nr:hypothetical protein [Nanoarchaeota archaeon]